MRLSFLSRATGAALLAAGSAALAASIEVKVASAGGQPLADAVVYAEPVTAPAPKPRQGAEIAQKGRKFLPLVSVVQTGTDISFPNNDTIRHHVYSFSSAKTFELKLYSGVPASPVRFDKPGTVVLGCNIHDQMLAYIHVVDTPHFGKTDASGMARIEGVAPGKYRLKAWHYALPPGAQPAEQALTLADDATASLNLPTVPPAPAD